MADKGTIETRLKLTGEDDYQKALKAAYGQLRVLNSELKASTSALGNNATAEQKNAVKADVLKRKIAEQKKIVEQLKAALNQAKTEYAGNAEVIQKWEVKLNNAQNALNNMTNDLDRATNGVEKMGNAMQEGANKSVQAVVNIGDVMNSVKDLASDIASTVQGAFNGMIDNIKWGVNQAWALIQGAMADVGNFKAITDAFGGSDVLAESMVRKAQSVGMSGSTVTGLISNLVTRTHAENKDLNALLTAWGEEEGDPLKYLQGSFDNHLEYYDAVWKKFVQKGSSLADAQILFGKGSSTDASVLGSKWSEASDFYEQAIVGTGIEISQDEIDRIDLLQKKLDQLKTTWASLLVKFGVALQAKLGIVQLTTDAQKVLEDIALVFFGDESKKTEYIGQLQIDVQKFITDLFASVGRFGEWMGEIAATFKSSPDQNVQAIGELFQTISDFCKWINTNSKTIIDALNLWLEYKIDSLISKINTGLSLEEWYTKIKQIAASLVDIFALMGVWKIARTTSDAGTTVTAAAAGGWISRIVGGVSSSASSFMNSGAGPMALSLWLSQVVPNISPEVHDFLYNDPFNPDGTKQGQFTKMQQDEKTAIQAFSRFIGKDVDISAWAWGYASDLIPEWYTSPYGYQMYKKSKNSGNIGYKQPDGSYVYNDYNQSGWYAYDLLTSGLASDYFIEWMSKQTDTHGNRYNMEWWTGLLGTGYQKYLEYLEQQEVDAITAGSNPGSDMNMWGSTPQSKWDMLTTLMQLQFGHTDSEQYGNYHMMLQATWPDMLQQWEKFVGYQQAWGDGTLDYETAYQEFLHTWIPKYYGFDGSYYEPGGGFYTQPVTTQTYGDVEGDYEPWTPPWANDGKVTLTQESANILAGALVGMAVQMDGQKVGWLAGPGVSQYLAANA